MPMLFSYNRQYFCFNDEFVLDAYYLTTNAARASSWLVTVQLELLNS